MTARISFGELRQFLLEMGFQEDLVQRTYPRFRHRPSNTVFMFRPYEPTDRVNPGDLVAVRRFLDERGLMEADEFERFLSKTPA